jgi:hypothetical protein
VARGVNNLLVVCAFYLFVSSGCGLGRAGDPPPAARGRDPWATAHLLVNGDAASILLFGGLLAWAAAEILSSTGPSRSGRRPPRQPLAKEATAVAHRVAVAAGGLGPRLDRPWPFGT